MMIELINQFVLISLAERDQPEAKTANRFARLFASTVSAETVQILPAIRACRRTRLSCLPSASPHARSPASLSRVANQTVSAGSIAPPT